MDPDFPLLAIELEIKFAGFIQLSASTCLYKISVLVLIIYYMFGFSVYTHFITVLTHSGNVALNLGLNKTGLTFNT